MRINQNGKYRSSRCLSQEEQPSVSRNLGIDLARPGVNTAPHRLRLFVSLPAKPNGDFHGADAVMTHHERRAEAI
jgi:hypothetical protein